MYGSAVVWVAGDMRRFAVKRRSDLVTLRGQVTGSVREQLPSYASNVELRGSTILMLGPGIGFAPR